MKSRKKVNIVLIIIAVLLVIGTVLVYLVGEKKLRWPEKKSYSGAKEVDSRASGDNNRNDATSSDEKKPEESKGTIPTEIQKVKESESISGDKTALAEKKDRFQGMTLKYNDKGIPVLMYHCIDKNANGSPDELKVPPEVFREQMKYLKDNGFITLTMDEAYNFFASNKGIPEKSVVLTFDDGYQDNYKNALPILKEYGFNATVFVITGMIGKTPDYMTEDQLKEMDANGFEVQDHTVSHPHLSTLTYDKQLRELKDSKEVLEKLLNKKVSYLAYPYGDKNQNTVKAAQEAGYSMAFTTAGTWSDKSDGILTLDRTYISALYSMDQFKTRVNKREW